MSDIRLPEGIRPSVSKGYSMTLSNNVVRTGMQGGAPRQGLDTHYEAIPVNVTFILTGWQVQAFTAFLQAIDNGASSFIMTSDTAYVNIRRGLQAPSTAIHRTGLTGTCHLRQPSRPSTTNAKRHSIRTCCRYINVMAAGYQRSLRRMA